MIHEEAGDLRCSCGQMCMSAYTRTPSDGRFIRRDETSSGKSTTHSIDQCYEMAIIYLAKGSRSAEERLD